MDLLKQMRKVAVTKMVQMLQEKFILMEVLEIFHGFESAKNKILEADPNLERSMTTHQGIEKILNHIISFTIRSRQTLWKTLEIFSQSTKTLFLNISNVLNYTILNK